MSTPPPSATVAARDPRSMAFRCRCAGIALAGALLCSIGVPHFATSADDTASTSERMAEAKLGLKVGETVPQFYVRAVTGPHQNKSVCYVCRHGERPVAMVLVREFCPNLDKLLEQIDRFVDGHRADGIRSFGVFLSDDPKATLPRVQTLAFDHKLEMPLTIAVAPTGGPAIDNLSADAAVTIILYRDHTVVAHHAWRRNELGLPELTRFSETLRDFVATAKMSPQAK